jgi:MoaA/NifB/PqqE/SkfB family radical SAM enzyme
VVKTAMSQYINPRSKILWHVDRINDIRRTGNTFAPVNVEIDLSNRCSHGCEWCHFAHTHTRGPLANKTAKPDGMLDCGDIMDPKLARSILYQLAETGVKSVTWSGGGEPTLHPQFDQVVTYASIVGLEQGIYTHGGHIDTGKALLLKHAMTFVYVSLDECTPEAFKKSKGVDRFNHVIDGIRRLVDARGKATIGVGFLMHRANVEQVDDMVTLGRTLGVDYVQFRPIIQYEQNAPAQLVEDTTWIGRVIVRLRDYAGDPFVQADGWRFEMYRDWQGHGYPTCNWAAMQTVVTPNGKLWRCVNRRGHDGALIGDLTVSPFADIWQQRGGTCAVADDCRVMCRGHIANLTLHQTLTEPAHANFI